MAARGDSKGLVSTPLDHKRAHPKDYYLTLSDHNASELKDTEAEYKRGKSDFLQITQNNRR